MDGWTDGRRCEVHLKIKQSYKEKYSLSFKVSFVLGQGRVPGGGRGGVFLRVCIGVRSIRISSGTRKRTVRLQWNPRCVIVSMLGNSYGV